MGKSAKAQTPKDREKEYEALCRSVGLSSEEESDSDESESGEEAESSSSSEEGPTTPTRGKGMITAESPQQRDGGSKGKRVANKPPDPSSSVPYATGVAASIASTPWNKSGTSSVDNQSSTFGTGEYPPLPTRLVGMGTDLVTLRPAAKTRSEHAASLQARVRPPPTAPPAITSETPPANPYERPGRRIVVNESANTIYTPNTAVWDGWDSELDRGSDEDQDGEYRKGLQGTLQRSEEYDMESLETTLTIDPIMRAQAAEARRLASLARDRLGEYVTEGQGRIGTATDDWLSPHNTAAAVMGDQFAPLGTSDTSSGLSKEEVSATDYRQPFAEVLDHPLVNKFLHGQSRVLCYRGVFNSVKHAKNFVHKHFKGSVNHEVYHPEEHHCASATWGGRGKQAEVRIAKAAPGYYRDQRELYVTTPGKELPHRSDRNIQKRPGMEISVPVVDTRNTVAGPMSLPSEVCRNLNGAYREPKQSNRRPKGDVAALKEPPEKGARGGHPTVLGYGESPSPGQATEDLIAREPQQDTEDNAGTQRDASLQDPTKRSASEAARQNEEDKQEIGTHIDLTSSPRATTALKSSMVTPKVTRVIPIDAAHLTYINAEEGACQGIRNVRPRSKGTGETFVSMTVIHKKQGVAPSVRVYESIKGLFTLLHKADPSVRLNPLYEVEEDDAVKFLPIGDPSALPLDMIGLGNYVQIGNAYTMSPAFGTDDDGNPRLQRPTYVVFRVYTKYDFDHVIGLIQSSLYEMNVIVKVKDMPSLNTRTRMALIGTTSEWCPASIHDALSKALTKHAEKLQKSGSLDLKHRHKPVPPFSLRKNKMKMPKMNHLLSKTDVEFIDYYQKLRQCLVFELADDDWEWFQLLMADFVAGGNMKRVVSRQASTLILPLGTDSSDHTTTRFLKAIKLQMSYAHHFRTLDCAGVQSLDYAVRVEVEPGVTTPFKNTNLRRELLSLRLPTKEDGTPGNTFIDGAHIVRAGPARGQLRILYQNTDVNENFVSTFPESLCTHVYQYLRKEKKYTRRCCTTILSSWFDAKEGLLALDAKWDAGTFTATSLQSLPHQAYFQDMEKLGLLEIAPELLQEMNERSTKKKYETDAMQRVAEHMNLKPCDDAHFSQVNSAASALTHNTHTTNGNESLRSVTSVQIEADLSRARGEFHTLSMRLRELAPDHEIFDETAFLDDAMDEMSLGSQRSVRLHELYKETRRNSLRLRTCINEIEQSVSLVRSPVGVPPPNSGSAAPSVPVKLGSQTEQRSGVVQGS